MFFSRPIEPVASSISLEFVFFLRIFNKSIGNLRPMLVSTYEAQIQS